MAAVSWQAVHVDGILSSQIHHFGSCLPIFVLIKDGLRFSLRVIANGGFEEDRWTPGLGIYNIRAFETIFEIVGDSEGAAFVIGVIFTLFDDLRIKVHAFRVGQGDVHPHHSSV